MGMGHGHLLTEEKEEDNEESEQSLQDGGNYTKTLLDKLKKERRMSKEAGGQRRRRPIPLLKFLRHVVLAFKKRALANCNVVFQIEASAMVHSNGCQADTLGRLTRPS